MSDVRHLLSHKYRRLCASRPGFLGQNNTAGYKETWQTYGNLWITLRRILVTVALRLESE